MPAVPAATLPSVMPTGTSGTPYQTGAGATPQAFGAEVGTAEQRLGAGLEQVGDVLAKHALKMQEDVNASIAKDLFLQGDIEVGKLTVDYNSLEGINRVNAYPQYVKDIEEVRNRLKASSPNDDVAKRFDADFSRRVGYSIVDGARGAATANKQYQNQTSAAVRSNTLSHIAVNAQDDKRFETELQIGLETFKREDEYRGSSEDVQKLKEREYVTGAWATRLDSMAKTDPLRARELLKAIPEDKIDGGKRLQLETNISQQIINVDSRVSADKIVQSGALISPEFKEHIKRVEGYSDKAKWDYKQYSSGYGTKAQPGDENLTPEQRKLVYEQRLDNELGRAANIVDQFAPGLPKGTREALIELTFNAGSAWTSAGLGKAIRAGNFETAKEIYTQYNQAGGKFNEGLLNRRLDFARSWGGEPVESDPTAKLALSMDKAKERAIEVFPNDPANQAKYLDTLQARIRSDNSLMETAARQMQLDMRNTVQRELVNDQSIISYDKLSPQAKQAYDNSPPSQQDVFNKQMRMNATADVPLTPERQNLYDKIHGEATTPSTRDQFLSRNITDLDLPRAQKSKLIAMQDNVKALVEKGVRSSAIIKDSQALLNDAGIRPSTTDTNMNNEFLRFKGVLDQRVEDFVNREKRIPNPKEGREMVKELTREIVTSPGTFWDSKDRAYNVISNQTPVKVDSIEAAKALPSGTVFILNGGEPRTRK